MKRWMKTTVALAVLVLALMTNCEQVSDPLTLSQFQTASNATLYNAATGVQNSVFYMYDNVLLTIQDLYPNEQTDVQIVRKSDGNIIKRMLVFTDENGVIKDLPVWYFNGYKKPGELAGSHKFIAHIEQPGVGREWKIFSIPFEARETLPSAPQLRIVDAAGNFVGASVVVGQPVYVEGSKCGVKKAIQVRLIYDKVSYTAGDPLTDVSDNGVESDNTEKNGSFEPTKICNTAILGAYDVVVDTEPFGVYNDGDVVTDLLFPGLLVQNPAGAADIIQDIACDAFGTYQNQFDSLATVYARVNAIVKPKLPSEFVNVFIAPHKALWQTGDALYSMRTVGTFEMPVQCLWNGYAGYLPLIRIHGGSLSSDPMPIKMWPGEYDVIIDVDRNYVYNPGTDILDGGSAGPGFTVPGKVPGIRFGASADNDFLGRTAGDPAIWGYFRDQVVTPVWGVVVDSLGGLVRDIPITFSIIDGPGSLSVPTATTGLNGAAFSVFTGATVGSATVVKLEATVKGKDYTKNVLIFRKIPWQHNQGIIVHNQGVVSGN